MQLDAQLENVRNSIFADMNKNKDIVFAGLVENTIVNNIPESLFVNYFLPCFIGRADNSRWVMEWISIAGTPMAEVAIVKDGTQEVLFKVPGILSTNGLFLNKNRGGIADIFTRYEQISNNIPSNGLSYLVAALTNKKEELTSNLNIDYAKSAWLHILQRYNIIPENTLNNSLNNSDNNLDDFLEF